MSTSASFNVLLVGLPVASDTFELAPGIVLKRLKKTPRVFDLAALGSKGFREWAALEPFLPYCWSELAITGSKLNKTNAGSLNPAWLASSLLVLRGHSMHFAIASATASWESFATVDGESVGQNTDGVKCSLLDYHIRTQYDGSDTGQSVDGDDVSWISRHFEPFNLLAAKSLKFRFALEAAFMWRFDKDPRAAIARLWSGIEAIFGVSSELVFRISVYSASLIEQRGERRRERFREVKELYSIRSKAVHGSKNSRDRLHHGMEGAFRLLRDLLLIYVDRGSDFDQTSLDSALLGD